MIHIACFGPFNIARLARRRWSRLVAQLPAMRCQVPMRKTWRSPEVAVSYQ